MGYKYLFGPVPSRRLGISLGIDLVPNKVCSLNCIYCEVGRTTILTNKRKEYVPIDEVITELRHYLGQYPQLDYLTFSGAGEPLLNSGIGRLITVIKHEFPQYKIALLTNGTLFCNEQVRQEVLQADLILPSLDAASEKIFQEINRPANGLKAADIIDGLVRLRQEFSGEIWLEIFFTPGLNDSLQELKLLKEAVEKIKPERVQLNSLDRPGTEYWVESTAREKLEKIADFFLPLPVEIIAKPLKKTPIKGFNQDIAGQILNTIRRRPCTTEDLREILNLKTNELNKYLNIFLAENKIESVKQDRGIFFKIKIPGT
jgi:wyosine [tRNA(Phe)-imidazoG37] synthetase (radical SAM superfamily)